jgi:hypothetical protein
VQPFGVNTLTVLVVETAHPLGICTKSNHGYVPLEPIVDPALDLLHLARPAIHTCD